MSTIPREETNASLASATGGDMRWVEIVSVTAISVAGLVTSWSSYQGTLWSGEQAAHYELANNYRVKGSQAALDAMITQATQVSLFSAWLNAKGAGNERLATIYSDRFPAELRPAFAEWLAQQPFKNPNAAPSPFRLPTYRRQGVIDAEALNARAEQEFQEGQRCNRLSDAFTRGSVMLAMSMFFGGIVQVLEGRGVRIALAAVSVISCLIGLWLIFTLPMLPMPPLN